MSVYNILAGASSPYTQTHRSHVAFHLGTPVPGNAQRQRLAAA